MKLKFFPPKHPNEPRILLFPLTELARGLERLKAELERLEATKHQEREAGKIKN